MILRSGGCVRSKWRRKEDTPDRPAPRLLRGNEVGIFFVVVVVEVVSGGGVAGVVSS